MPILGGDGMLRAMAAVPALPAHPGHHDEFARRGSNRRKVQGYVGFLHKPFRVAAVLSIVARVLGRTTNDGP